MFFDIVKRRSIRKSLAAMSRAAIHIQALLDCAPFGSVSKQAGLSDHTDLTTDDGGRAAEGCRL
jgi:hypothetical protein